MTRAPAAAARYGGAELRAAEGGPAFLFRRDYRDYFLPLLGLTRGLGGLKLEESMKDSEITLDYLADNVWIVGSPETVRRGLDAFIKHTRTDEIMVTGTNSLSASTALFFTNNGLKGDTVPKNRV